jgi:hypothetical protein
VTSAAKRAPVGLFDSLGPSPAGAAAALSAGLAANRVYGRLSRLSDARLAARGPTRADISRLTFEAPNTR